MPIGKSINSEQKQELLEKAITSAKKIFTNNEKLLSAVVQQKPLLNLLPHSIIVTNKRVIRFTPRIFSETFEDFLWKDIRDVHLNEKLFGCEIKLEFENDTIIVDKLPKNQAKELYTIAQEREEEWVEKKRLRRMEEERASSGASEITIGAMNENSSTRTKLAELRNLLEDGLITQDEYHKKKDLLLKKF
ncbi:MAG: PH domain-containing protein [Candidatus Aenigmarchaeota archaeon]|nr:PH domain-containing protein [Candidatus Aenigmarchaeota archaeon]